MKRVLSLILTAALLLGICGMTAAAGGNCPHQDPFYLSQPGETCVLFCGECGEILSERQPHDYDGNGVCTRCGAVKPWRSELAAPVIQVTADKESYDLYDSVTVTVTITNPEEISDWWTSEIRTLWENPEDWLSKSQMDTGLFRFNGEGAAGSALPNKFTVVSVTDWSMTFTLEGMLRLEESEFPEFTGDRELEADIELFGHEEMRVYAVTTIHYTGRCVPCEGEHQFGEWQFAGAVYSEDSDAYGHVRYCELCGFKEEKKEHCTPGEPEREYFCDDGGHKTDCYGETVSCAVCHYLLEYEVHHTDLHPVDNGNPPTCTEWGYEDKYEVCGACGRSVYDNAVYRSLPPLGHDMDNGVCTRCHRTFSQLDCVATLTVDKTEVGEGELLTATYTVKDAQNAPLSGVTVKGYCSAYPGLEEYVLGSQMTDGDGTVRFQIRPAARFGVYEGTPLGENFITLSAEDYGDSTATAYFTFTGGESILTGCTGTLEADRELVADYYDTGETVTFSLQIKDGSGDPVPAAVFGFAVLDLKGNPADGPYWDRTDGAGNRDLQFGFTQSEMLAGTYIFEVTCGDLTLTKSFDFISPSLFTPGDPDGDGKVTSTDARLALQVSVGKIQDDEVTCPQALDVDGDNQVTSTDARLMLQKAVGKIGAFPA